MSELTDTEPTPAPRTVPPLMIAAWEGAISEPDPLAALGATRALVGLLSTWESRLVGEAMEAGATWEVVGGTVGVSRQAAWERFHNGAYEFRRQVKADALEIRTRHRQETREFRQRVKQQATSIRGS
jgi:hypothetical protein